jgi:RNA polymerase sigma-70 factor, ECF subfamily
MSEATFDDLLDRARSGDQLAFAALYRAVQPLLGRCLRVQSPDHAEDAAADAWLEVARSIDCFEGDERGFRAWVFTIARRKVVDRVRFETRRPTDALDEEAERRLAAVPDTAEVVEQAEATRAAIALVRTLPPDQAEIVMLRVVAGLDNAEVARLVSKSPGAVRVLAHRGLRRLARTMALQQAQTTRSAEGGVTR